MEVELDLGMHLHLLDLFSSSYIFLNDNCINRKDKSGHIKWKSIVTSVIVLNS